MPSIQEVEKYWDERPCNLKHSSSPFLTKKYFDEVEKRKYFVESHIPKFAEFPIWKNKRVLEIGCGIGTDAVNFARHGASYTGIELSPFSLWITQERFRVYGLKGRLIRGDAENTLLDYFDLIYSFGVIHHSPNPQLIVDNVKEMMHPNSIFKLMLYSKYSYKNFRIKLGLDQPEAQENCPIANTYSYKDIKNLLGGFKILEIKKDHIFKWDIESYKRYEYRHNLISQVPGFKQLEKVAGWHTLITCCLKP